MNKKRKERQEIGERARMKRIRRILATLVGVGLLVSGAVFYVSSVSSAPEFEIDTARHGRLRLSDMRGQKVVLISFVSTECGYCKDRLVGLERQYREFKDKGAEILAITTDSPQKVSRMVTKLNISFPVASDQTKEIASRFHLLNKRTDKAETATVLIDTQGKIRWLRVGKSASDHPPAREILERLGKAS